MEPTQRPAPDGAAAPESQPGRRGVSISITPRTVWYIAGVAVSLAIIWLLITRALSALLIVFIAITIAEAARPVVLRLEQRRVPRPVGALLVLLAAGIVLGVLVWILLTPLISEIGTLTANAPEYTKRLQGWIASSSDTLHANGQLGSFIDGLGRQFFSSLQGLAPSLIQVPFTLLSGAFGALLSFVVTITIIVFWLTSSAHLRVFLLGLFPERAQAEVDTIFADMGRSLGGYVRGVLIAMLLIGLFTALGLGVLGVPYALLLGVLAGLTECIPYLGPWLSGVVAVLVALVTVDPLKALEVVILFLLVQQIEGNLVQPIVMSRSVHLDPLLVLIAILVGSELLGLVGAVLAVPFVALAQSLVTHALAPAIRRAVGREEPPTVSPPDSASGAKPAEAATSA
ncbi:MAG TPA: AI-2E family transporter [Ktedonobacterales bacterium]